MTGFGLGEAKLRDGRLSTEVRSLNHRFLELRVRLAPEIAEHTSYVEQTCRERLGRGRYDVSVRVEGAALPPFELDLERAKHAYRALERLRDELSPSAELPLGLLASFPTLIAISPAGDPESLRRALSESVARALSSLDAMRSTEGSALAADLAEHCAEAKRLLEAIAAQSSGLVEAQRQRLELRLQRLLDGLDGLDPARLELEVALLADRSDVTEELVRLRSHFEQFESSLISDGPVGRKLDFLLQEIAREINTVGAKCQDAHLSHLVVALKTEVERLREQVQNVE